MTTDATPLTEAERAELEALRAEKARREAAEKARRERAELEALRAERAAAPRSEQPREASAAAVRTSRPAKPAHMRPAPESVRSPQAPSRPVAAQKPDADEMSFGKRMVTAPAPQTEDDLPGMPPAQKIILIVCALLVLVAVVYIALSNTGVI